MLAFTLPVLIFIAPMATVKPAAKAASVEERQGVHMESTPAQKPKGGEGLRLPVSIHVNLRNDSAGAPAKSLTIAPAFPRSGFQINVEMAF